MKRKEAETYLAEIIREAIQKEREDCAKMLAGYGRWLTPSEAAALIRARNK